VGRIQVKVKRGWFWFTCTRLSVIYHAKRTLKPTRWGVKWTGKQLVRLWSCRILINGGSGPAEKKLKVTQPGMCQRSQESRDERGIFFPLLSTPNILEEWQAATASGRNSLAFSSCSWSLSTAELHVRLALAAVSVDYIDESQPSFLSRWDVLFMGSPRFAE
jgi:hypothetical protein